MKFVEQIKNNLLEISLVGCLVKALAFEPTFGLALAIISLVVSMTYKYSLNKKKVDDHADLVKQIAESQEKFAKSLAEYQAKADNDLQVVNNKLDGINIDRQIKQAAINEQAPQTIKKAIRSF